MYSKAVFNNLNLPRQVMTPCNRIIFIDNIKMYLRLPEIHFLSHSGGYYAWIMKNKISCYLPLPNIYYNSKVCDFDYTIDISVIDSFFQTRFSYTFEDTFSSLKDYPHYYALNRYIETYEKNINAWNLGKNVLNQKTIQFYFDNPIAIDDTEAKIHGT